jgi:hypothetical protein
MFVPWEEQMSAFGTKRTSRQHSVMSAFGGKADIARTHSNAAIGLRHSEQNLQFMELESVDAVVATHNAT